MATTDNNLSKSPYSLNISDLKIGIVVANWNKEITYALRNGAMDYLKQNGFSERQLIVHEVPGSFELCLGAQWLLDSGCDAVMAFGCVIQGETPHFTFVCNAVSQGLMDIAINTKKPAIFGVLTTNTMQQAQERAGGKLGNKGTEAAETTMWMLGLQQKL